MKGVTGFHLWWQFIYVAAVSNILRKYMIANALNKFFYLFIKIIIRANL